MFMFIYILNSVFDAIWYRVFIFCRYDSLVQVQSPLTIQVIADRWRNPYWNQWIIPTVYIRIVQLVELELQHMASKSKYELMIVRSLCIM